MFALKCSVGTAFGQVVRNGQDSLTGVPVCLRSVLPPRRPHRLRRGNCGKNATKAMRIRETSPTGIFRHGLDKKVIWTCREELLTHVHFDVRQNNFIGWRVEEDVDLRRRFTETINAAIPTRVAPNRT